MAWRRRAAAARLQGGVLLGALALACVGAPPRDAQALGGLGRARRLVAPAQLRGLAALGPRRLHLCLRAAPVGPPRARCAGLARHRCAARGAPGAHQSQVGAEPVGASAAATQPRGAQDCQRKQPADLCRRAGRGWGAQEGGVDRAAGLPGSLRARKAQLQHARKRQNARAQPRQATTPPPARRLPERAARRAPALVAGPVRALPSQEGMGGRRRCAARPSMACHAHWRTLRLPCQRAAGCAAPRGLPASTCYSHSSPAVL